MLTILVAEADSLLAQYYVTLLSQWNCETVVEHRGTDAIRRAATFGPTSLWWVSSCPKWEVLKLLSSCLKSVPERRSSSLRSRFRAEIFKWKC